MREFSLLVVICVGAITAFATFLLVRLHYTGEGAHMYTELVTTALGGGFITFLALMLFRATPKKPTDTW